MRAFDQADPLAVALDELSVLGGELEQQALGSLRARLTEQRLRVLVAGEAKRGKSTLVNALLGRAVLPTGVTPLTALATTLRYGRDERVTATIPSGQIEVFPLTALDYLVTEHGNPGNVRNLSAVTVAVDVPLLARGIELVDTPGTGSVYEHNTDEAEAALETMDAAVVVLTADPPVSAAERQLISRVAKLSVSMFVVLNKADHLAGDELPEVLAFTTQVVGGAAGRPARIYPVSARAALTAAGDAGFAEFTADFSAYLEHGRGADLRRSVDGHARRIAGALRDEVILARRAAELRGEDSAQRVQAFAARLAAVTDRRRDAADLTAAESKRMLAALNEAADLAARACTARVVARLDDLLGDGLRSSPAAVIERTGRARLGDLAVVEAESWRSERAAALEAGLSALDQRLTDALAAELDAVRAAAAELLGLDLTLGAPDQRLAPDVRFFYQVAEDAGQTELLAGAIRRRLPGEAGRNRARGHLRREASGLVPRQIGRARADLQYRLAEATRRLVRAVDARYDEATSRLERALADAATLRGATEEEVAARDVELTDRLTAIEHVLTLLDCATLRAAGAASQIAT